MDKEVIYGQVVAKANHYKTVPDGAGGKRIIKDDAIRDYERSFLEQCKVYAGRCIDRPFKFHAKVYYRNWSYDIDNSIKTILDCLQMAQAITNDKLCIEIHAYKAIDRTNPRVIFAIEETEPKLF